MSVILLTSSLVGWVLGIIPSGIAYMFSRIGDAASYG